MPDPTKQLQQRKREIHDRLVMYGSIASGMSIATSANSEADRAKLKLMLSNLDLLDAEHLEGAMRHGVEKVVHIAIYNAQLIAEAVVLGKHQPNND